ncbi:MAG: hypothetical protein ACYTGB_05195 [Planctomycetota bacterium]|jgi:hypothetical protein
MSDYQTPQDQDGRGPEPVGAPPGLQQAPAPPAPPLDPPAPSPESLVAAPAIFLMVTAGVSAVAFLLIAVLVLVVTLTGHVALEGTPTQRMVQGALATAFYLYLSLANLILLIAANKMRTLSSYPLAMASAILAVIPVLSPCCALGIPFGIWALVVLGKPEVVDAFLRNRR